MPKVSAAIRSLQRRSVHVPVTTDRLPVGTIPASIPGKLEPSMMELRLAALKSAEQDQPTTAEQPQVPTMPMAIRQTLEPSMMDLRTAALKSSEQQSAPPVRQASRLPMSLPSTQLEMPRVEPIQSEIARTLPASNIAPSPAAALPMPFPDAGLPTPAPTQPAASAPLESAQLSAQLQKLNAPPTAKDALLKAVLAFAPTAIAGLTGGLPAAAGAAQGTTAGLAAQGVEETQRKKDLLTQVESARGREERMAERQLTTNERASEANLRKLEIEGTNASRLEGVKLNNQIRSDIQDLKNTLTTRSQDQNLAVKGFTRDPITGEIKRAPEGAAKDQAELDYKQALTDHQKASADAERERGNPNSPRFQQAQQRLAATAERLKLSQQQFEMRAFGTNQGEALPGAMITDSGQPVGTGFQQNVRPTGQERNKGDMAISAKEQIADIKKIMQSRHDIFGPAAGRKTDFTVWLGSQDPDAQRFLAARTIAADHMAGTFGGRSEAALQALDAAIGQFKDNPAAAIAGLDQLDKANAIFVQKGTVDTVGSGTAIELERDPITKKLREKKK